MSEILSQVIPSTLLRSLLAYWEAKRRDHALPSRADIEPTEIPRLMPSLVLIDLVGEAERLRYRLIGTEAVALYGTEVTGRFLDDCHDGPGCAFLTGVYREARTAGAPLYWAGEARRGEVRKGRKERGRFTIQQLVLPLRKVSTDNILLIGMDAADRRRSAAPRTKRVAAIDPRLQRVWSIDPSGVIERPGTAFCR